MPTGWLADDPLTDFETRSYVFDDVGKHVYCGGTGPAVIIMSEMPGITPYVSRFARWVRDAGFRVLMPSLFGTDGAVPDPADGAAVFRRACISAEFRALGAGTASPVTRWLRALAHAAHAECAGPGVGAIGMCFTGNFALAMMLEPSVRAPVLCQPSLPLDDPGGIEMSTAELDAVRERLRREDLTVLGYRFEGDRFCTAARFASYEVALGDRFVGHVLPDSAAGMDVPDYFARYVRCAHSVVTTNLVDRAGEPTLAARDEIIAFFRARLSPAGTG